MKQIIALFLFLFVYLQAQAQFRMVGTGTWSTLTDSTYQATVTFSADLSGNGYLATAIVDTFRVFTGTEKIYTVDSVWNKSFSQATMRIKEYAGTQGAPSGQVMCYDPAGKVTLPQAPIGSTGSTAQIQAAVVTYNARQTITDGDKGDIDVTSSGATWTIDTASVTWLKLAQPVKDSIAAATGSTDLTYTQSTRLLESSTGTDVTLPNATHNLPGLMPAVAGLGAPGGGVDPVNDLLPLGDASSGGIAGPTVNAVVQAATLGTGQVTSTSILDGTIALGDLGFTPWTATNDGSGSGLDADLLDGEHGTYYLNLGNHTGRILAYSNLPQVGSPGILGNTGPGAADIQTLASVPANLGGTGQTSYMVGDLLYASTTSALSKLAGVATGNALISGGVGTAPSWGKIALTTHVSGTLPIANGGTNITTYAVGDLLYASGTNTLAKLAAGTNGHVLTMVAGAPAWAAATGGVTGSGTTSYIPKFSGSTSVNNSLLYDTGSGINIGATSGASGVYNLYTYKNQSTNSTTSLVQSTLDVSISTTATTIQESQSNVININSTGGSTGTGNYPRAVRNNINFTTTSSGSYETVAANLNSIDVRTVSTTSLTNAYGSSNLIYAVLAGVSLTNAFGYYSNNRTNSTATITNSYGFYAENATGSSATITNAYGLYVATLRGANNYSVYSAASDAVLFNAGSATFGGVIRGADGTASAPAYTFTNDLDVGIYRPTADVVGITTNGAEIARFSTTQFLVNTLGTVAAPAISFVGDPNTGMYSTGADELAFATNGTSRLRITTQMLANDGSAAAPYYTFLNDTNTGMYRTGADALAFATNGTARVHISNSGLAVGGTTANYGGNFHGSFHSFVGIISASGAANAGVMYENAVDANDSWTTYRADDGKFVMAHSTAYPFSSETRTFEAQVEKFSFLTNVVKLENITATTASGLTAANGDLIYVSSTNGTFTSVGFWGRENGVWVKL